jgi:hypothetical protein
MHAGKEVHMAEHPPPSQLSPESRQYLERLLENCKSVNGPGDKLLIKMLEELLAGKRPPPKINP